MAKIIKVPVDEKMYTIFKDTFNKCVQLFGLTDWSITFYFEKLSTSVAFISYDVNARWCKVYFNNTTVSNLDIIPEEDAKKAALHEFAHLLTGELYHAATVRTVSDDDISRISEVISRRFENALKDLI